MAQDLGVHREALRQWVPQAEADQGRRSDRPTSNELEELKRLRKENAELRRANDPEGGECLFRPICAPTCPWTR
jgi:transposase